LLLGLISKAGLRVAVARIYHALIILKTVKKMTLFQLFFAAAELPLRTAKKLTAVVRRPCLYPLFFQGDGYKNRKLVILKKEKRRKRYYCQC